MFPEEMDDGGDFLSAKYPAVWGGGVVWCGVVWLLCKFLMVSDHHQRVRYVPEPEQVCGSGTV